MHHEYRGPYSRSRPCHERSTGDIKETPGGQLGDSKGPAGRHSEGSKISYMDQCTFGAVRPSGRAGLPIRKRQSSEIAGEPKEGDQALLQSNAAQNAGFRKAVERLPAYRLLNLLAKRSRGRPWRSLRPSPLAPSLRLAVSPGVEFLKRSPSFTFLFARLAADTRAGKSNPAAAKTADEAPPRPLDDASIMRLLVAAAPPSATLGCHPRFLFAPMAGKLSSPTRPRFSDHDRSPPTERPSSSPPNLPDPYEQRATQACVRPLASSRAQNAALQRQSSERRSAVPVRHGPADGEHDEWESWRGEGRASFTSLFASDARPILTRPNGSSSWLSATTPMTRTSAESATISSASANSSTRWIMPRTLFLTANLPRTPDACSRAPASRRCRRPFCKTHR